MFDLYIENIKNQIDVRANLSQIRALLKEEAGKADALLLTRNLDVILHCLEEDDPKIRKNTALLLKDMSEYLEPDDRAYVLSELLKALKMEETLFVQGAYLKAMTSYEYNTIQEELESRLRELTEQTWEDGDLKHVREQKALLHAMLPKEDTNETLTRADLHKSYQVLLTAEPFAVNYLLEEFSEAKATPLGVRTTIKSWKRLDEVRTYQECWFLIPVKRDYPVTLDHTAEALLLSAFPRMLQEFYGKTSISFRLRMRGRKPEEHFANQTKRISFELEERSQGLLQNKTSDYDVELILMQKKDDSFSPYLRLCKPEDQRFSYRIHTEATSMAPTSASAVISAVSKYLLSDAQILDPMAGSGTLLVERCKKLPAREIYAIDTYAKAVNGGRENAAKAGLKVNYINRDYFDFKHDYLFDEILTELPDLFQKDAMEKETFFRHFFHKSLEVTREGAVWILITAEGNLLKKYIRLHEELSLEREIPFRSHASIYVIKRK